MKKSNLKMYTVLLTLITVIGLSGCKDKGNNSGGSGNANENQPLVFSTQALDGLFNPFYATSGTDMEIVGMTQISMLSTNSEGKVAYGEDEPVVVLDYETVTTGTQDVDQETKYTFVLKNNVKFSNGSPLTIKDVLFNMYVYLDPNYTGSTTMYSTDIKGLQEYRTQTADENEQNSFNEIFNAAAQDRVDALNYAANLIFDEHPNTTIDIPTMTNYLAEKQTELGEGYTTLVDDFEFACSTFEAELRTDYNNNLDSYEDLGLENDVESFLYAEGYITIDEDKPAAERVDYLLGKDVSYLPIDDVIEIIYEDKLPMSITEITTYWVTATTMLDSFAAAAREEYFDSQVGEDGNYRFPNVSGITWTNKGMTMPNSKKVIAEVVYNADGSIASGNEVLEIVINGVDPKAIWNFGFTVAPMYYYSSAEQIALWDGINHFGVDFGSTEFQNDVLKGGDKLDLPVGGGAYKATTRDSRSDIVTADTFFDNNVVYFERNEHFIMGAPKIRLIRYQVTSDSQLLNALLTGAIHYAQPNAKSEVMQQLNDNATRGFDFVSSTTLGYGYIGINAGKDEEGLSDIRVRRAIMHSMNTALCLNYYPGTAQTIHRPISILSWAYPEGAEAYYPFDGTGETSKNLLLEAGYSYNSRNELVKNNKQLKIKFVVAGDTEDHPAFATLRESARILNSIGCDIDVGPDNNALKKLSNGELSVWAAAWGSTIDPDMYQVYHMDSTATSVLNWGYKQILRNTTKYATEYQIISELSDLIDEGRAYLDEATRSEIYSDALDKIMELAVELPTYQRQDLFAYNTNIIDVSTLTPKNLVSAYNGPISKIWEVSLKD